MKNVLVLTALMLSAGLIEVDAQLAGTNLQLQGGGPSPVTVVNANPQATGSATYYYWVIAKSVRGNASPSFPAAVFNGPNTLGSAPNTITVVWNAVANATTYDVLRTTTNQQPATCTCAVVLATASLSVVDNGSSLSAYTVNTTPSFVAANIYLDSVSQANPFVAVQILNPLTGISPSFPIGLTKTPNVVTFSATPVFNASLSSVQQITLTANVTSSSITNMVAGQRIATVICQDATGSRTFVPPAALHGFTTIGSTASLCSAQEFVAVSATLAYAVAAGSTNQ